MSDFETAPRSAMERKFRRCIMHGCFSHYTRAVFKNLQKIGLSKLFFKHNAFKKWVKHIMAVPLLPADQIHPAFESLFRHVFTFNRADRVLYNRFKSYIQRQWMQKIRPENLSVYALDSATNNGAESFHSLLKSDIKVHHPNVYTFMVHINDILADKSLDLQRWRNGLQITRDRLAEIVNILNLRREAEAELELTGDVDQFLSAVSFTFDIQVQLLINVYQNNPNILDEDPDIFPQELLVEDEPDQDIEMDDNDNFAPVQEGLCRWCNQVVLEKCVFNCGHGHGCIPCSQNFIQNYNGDNIQGPICPSDNCDVAAVIVIPIQLQLR